MKSIIHLLATLLCGNLLAAETASAISRQTRDISGWQVHIQNKLLESEPAATAHALGLLKTMLDEIVRDVPAPAVAELRKVPLYFSPAYQPGQSGAEYHPGAEWLRENGRDPHMARGVEFSGVHDFAAEMRRMPNFALHELAHAFHHRVLKGGFDHAELKAAYMRVKAAGKYDRVERARTDGKPNTIERAYAMTDPMEYFAETTEAYFSRNDFFPFTRAELKQHDPEMFTLLIKLWGLPSAPLNLLLFTADDMNFDSSGVYGGPIKDLTPHIDRLAGQGLRFERAYSTVAVCQPSRQVMFTGLYPHRSGSMGFFPLQPEVRTLQQQLHAAGYLISAFGKNPHHQPTEKFCADVADDKIARHPSQLAAATRKFLKSAREQDRPFFHNVNCYDPHRPFIGMKGPEDLAGGEAPSRRVQPEEITSVPGFLEDLPEIRRELAGYYTGVRRLDDALGAVLAVLAEEGFADNTLVVFWAGDHGMSFPFAKSNCYENSSRGALIVRWPGVAKPGTVDRAHLVAALDFTPTLLDAAGLPPLPGVDGRSFLPVVKGGTLPGWDRVFTFYNAAFGNKWLPMRCARTRDRAYIWNPWSDGQRNYATENMSGLTWKAMLAAAATRDDIKTRTDFYLRRVPEEFYDLTTDPNERSNLIGEPSRREEIEAMRTDLLALMRRTGDPFTAAFADRENQALVADTLRKVSSEYSKKPPVEKE